MFLKFFLQIVVVFIFTTNLFANNLGSVTGLKIPRFVSLKSNDANIRVGPSTNYPILLKYLQTNYPLKIIEEHEDWRRVTDFDNNNGWIHKSLIKGERSGIIISKDKKNIKIYNTVSGFIIGEVSNGTIVNILKCKLDACLIEISKYKGWVYKNFLWGVTAKDQFNVKFYQIFIDYYFQTINYLRAKVYKYYV